MVLSRHGNDTETAPQWYNYGTTIAEVDLLGSLPFPVFNCELA